MPKLLIHPFISSFSKENTNDTSEKSSARGSVKKKSAPRESKLLSIKEASNGEERSEFTFGSGHRNSYSSKSSESFPSELKKFLTKGSGQESSNGESGTESQVATYEQFLQHRFSEVTNMHPLPSNSPAVPLRIQDRKIIKPITSPMLNSAVDENPHRYNFIF